MREIASLIVFTGKDAFPIDLTKFTRVIEHLYEYESCIDVSIEFYIGDELVERMWNPSCDIKYKLKEAHDE